jgi:hypothetical protein
VGSLAEVLVYNKALSDAERAQIESYLTSRWLTAATPTTAATVPFTVAPAGTPASSGVSVTFNGGSPQIIFTGTPGARYTVQRSTNLGDPLGWVDLSTTNIPAAGEFEFVDPDPQSPAAFYRLRYNP